MWKEGNKILFQVRVVERNELAITNAAVVLHSASASPSQSSATQSTFFFLRILSFFSYLKKIIFSFRFGDCWIPIFFLFPTN